VVRDPNGILVYVHQAIEPDAEHARCIKDPQ